MLYRVKLNNNVLLKFIFFHFLTQIPKLLSEVHPVSVEVEWVPVVVGALFKMIGTPVVCFTNIALHNNMKILKIRTYPTIMLDLLESNDNFLAQWG